MELQKKLYMQTKRNVWEIYGLLKTDKELLCNG